MCLCFSNKKKSLDNINKWVMKKDVALKHGILISNVNNICNIVPKPFYRKAIVRLRTEKIYRKCYYNDTDYIVLKMLGLTQDKN